MNDYKLRSDCELKRDCTLCIRPKRIGYISEIVRGVEWYRPLYEYEHENKTYKATSPWSYHSKEVNKFFKCKNKMNLMVNPSDPQVCYSPREWSLRSKRLPCKRRMG